ncbi:actin filament-associated protein 1-like 2 isoform X1 [Pimephales promelas]|uniref:actin filament-associated protein 1-like 2 isoform X1 n=1 Tax=Pimephales promelas TaxID=90988 RepID=UPI0019554FB7|nr:actin filament-associated protein 1-like 2 isoform X1 [Pimephales promelas]KAG1954911.1 actin filament-associated protein 1-like [Pimephales promelas]KAG1954912.1 actin filament-associated protein 1-like [Pimephales promelas]
MDQHQVLSQLLEQLQRFLKILDGEKLSGNATVQKGLVNELLQSYKSSNGEDEEYIYMNKVIVTGQNQDRTDKDHRPEANGEPGKHQSPPEPPPPRPCNLGREPFPLPPAPAPASLVPESYYEDPQPYDPISINEDTEPVSSSYESYDEEEVTKGKSTAQHQWPSPEASIELMKDARICAFLWRKKWLGQWAKQLCVIREHRLLCYKSSKDQTPLLDISLLGCSVIYKEKQTKRKEHKLKITPLGGEAIVLGLQSKEQAEQWLKVIQEISPKNTAGSDVTDSPTLICTKGELSERYSVASESGSSTDSHAENLENKDVKKKYGKFSNLMNIGKKKISSLESPEKSVDPSGYLNVLVNAHWRSRWCSVKDRQLWIYTDKSRSKVSQQPLSLEGCMVLPDPSPEHLYSFRIQMDGEELAILEAKSSADMGHWLGLILSQTGTKTEPEDLTYDYVNSERICSIVNAAKTSMYLMQRRYSEPNTYTDSPPSDPYTCDDIYDDVASTENEQEEVQEVQNGSEEGTASAEENGKERVYLDLIPVRSFLHLSSGSVSPQMSNTVQTELSPSAAPEHDQLQPQESEYETSLPSSTEILDPTPGAPRVDADPSPAPNLCVQPQKISFLSQQNQKRASLSHQTQTLPQMPQSPPTSRGRAASADRLLDRLKFSPAAAPGSVEVKLGKNRTEADVRRYTDDRDRLEREREEVKNILATLRKDRREVKEELNSCQDPTQQASLEARLKQMEETCREAERRRVEVELSLMEVKESLRKVEAGPFTLGTTVDSSVLETLTPKMAPVASPAPNTNTPTNNGDSPVNCATAMKNRPVSIMAPNKGNVLQKAKEWEKKSTT